MNIKITITLLINTVATLTLLSGCGIYSTYSRPDTISTEGIYRDAGILSADQDSTGLATLDWRELFTDPYLQQLIESALANNVDMRTAYLRVEQAKASLQTARLSFLPSFNLAFQGNIVNFDGGKSNYTYSLPVAASWEVDVFGRLRNAKRRARANYEQSQEYSHAVQTQLISTIANTYYTLLMLDNQLQISEETAANWKENIKTMRALKEAAMANEASVSQTEANYYAIEASLPDIRKQIYEVENTLSNLLGQPAHTIERGTFTELYIPETLQTGVPLQLLANRPDVRSAELIVEAAFYGTAEARSAFYPSLVLNGTAGWTNEAGSYIVNPGKLLLTAIGSLTQPLFNKGALRANLKISQAQQEEAVLNFQQSILNAGTEVVNALKQVETARTKADWRNQQITSLHTAVHSTELLMRHGSSTYLEVLTAQQALLSAQLSQVTDKFEEIQGVINLYHALGGGRQLNNEQL